MIYLLFGWQGIRHRFPIDTVLYGRPRGYGSLTYFGEVRPRRKSA